MFYNPVREFPVFIGISALCQGTTDLVLVVIRFETSAIGLFVFLAVIIKLMETESWLPVLRLHLQLEGNSLFSFSVKSNAFGCETSAGRRRDSGVLVVLFVVHHVDLMYLSHHLCASVMFQMGSDHDCRWPEKLCFSQSGCEKIIS